MKKLLVIAVVALMLVGCSNEEPEATATPVPTAEATATPAATATPDSSEATATPDSTEGTTLLGSAVGYGDDLFVEVTVDADGVITNVVVTEHSETEGVSDPALADVPAAIMAAGTTEGVDTVAGATVSSQAILDAVNAAIATAE